MHGWNQPLYNLLHHKAHHFLRIRSDNQIKIRIYIRCLASSTQQGIVVEASYKDLQLCINKIKCYFDIFQQSMPSILTLPQVHSCHIDQLYCYYISWKTSDKNHASPEVWQCSDLWTLPACTCANSLHPICFPPLLTTLHSQLFIHQWQHILIK